MLFNSISFAIFLPVVFILYWFITNRSLRYQNFLLLIASYFFYACWDWRFLFLLAFSTFLDYFTGRRIFVARNQTTKRCWFLISIIVNLGFLAIFKYYNFFIESFAGAVQKFGLHINPWTLKVILPLGISFYTFHGLSYVIDIYKNRIKAENNIIDYSVFVSFFPLLVAGPIERATHLLPQIKRKRSFNYEKAVDGLRQILWGLFKKIVIADQCAQFSNLAFNYTSDHSGSELVLGAVFFAFQIYGDFSGYSDIAIGTAKLFGIDLLRNFAFPYFSRDIPEFWRRWHISLSTWFRDYLYIPLGGSKSATPLVIRNIFIIFIISGFWHGANWTFIVWGFLHAVYMIPWIIFKTNRRHLSIVAPGKVLPGWKQFLQILLTFSLTVFAWIFFRATSVEHAFEYISRMAGGIVQNPVSLSINAIRENKLTCILLLMFILIEWSGREQEYAIAKAGFNWYQPVRWAMYTLLVLSICYFTRGEEQFIYFQF